MQGESSPLLETKVEEETPQTLTLLGLPAWLFCLLWIAFGVAAACYIEGWGVHTALYVIVQVVTTIGYGDITVAGDRMKLWVACYIFATLLLIVGYITELTSELASAQANFLKRHMAHVKKAQDGNPAVLSGLGTLGASFVVFFSFATAGTVFYAIVEPCACSYGATSIEGCVEYPVEQCFLTGGATLSWVEAFYMSIITLTTVGFGDHSPKSHTGRAFGCVWMLCGVAATANLMTQFGQTLMEHKRHKHSLRNVSYPLFAQIDTTNDGVLSRSEFRHFALLKFGLVKPADFAEIDALFDEIDADKTGALTFAEIAQACDAPTGTKLTADEAEWRDRAAEA